MVEFYQDGLPPPEPAPADAEDDGRDTEGPDEEVDANVPAGVGGFVAVRKDEEGEGKGVVDERDEDLLAHGWLLMASLLR